MAKAERVLEMKNKEDCLVLGEDPADVITPEVQLQIHTEMCSMIEPVHGSMRNEEQWRKPNEKKIASTCSQSGLDYLQNFKTTLVWINIKKKSKCSISKIK